MFIYKEYEDETCYSEECLRLIENEKFLEIELVKNALNVYIKQNLFNTDTTEEHITWFLKKLFSFDFSVTLEKIETNITRCNISIPYGFEKATLCVEVRDNESVA